ncbi:MAG: hypothetical protein K5872_17520 [Rhizobiaceae bacterium]|nr:hypothetical protein [Rhizobiaceae bacterium]MCV0408025.1 hypothetical protein [Rhizobiaceae bacterium]
MSRTPARWSAIFAILVVAGCASRADLGDPMALSCTEIDGAVDRSSKDISAAARSRGRVDSYDPPRWLLGAPRAQQAFVDRQTRRIDELKSAQDQVVAEYQRRCR